MDNLMNITIKQLSENLLNDYLYFFDNIAFVDNREWDGCYCMFYHHDNDVKDWLSRSKEDNRTMAINMIKDHKLNGFLAYNNETPIAWCNANDKKSFSFNKNLNKVYGDFDDSIVSIVCFLVSHQYRRCGISTQLLQAVINYYQKTGKKHLEAYPFKNTIKDSENYHGPSSLYIKNGFYIDKEYGKYIVMKYNLS
jgi:GNAT superfamily N-acetyltransferase